MEGFVQTRNMPEIDGSEIVYLYSPKDYVDHKFICEYFNTHENVNCIRLEFAGNVRPHYFFRNVYFNEGVED